MSGDDHTKTYDDSHQITDGDFLSPYVVLGLECSRPLAGAGRYSIAEVDALILSRGSPRRAVRIANGGSGELELHVPDGWMSSKHARIERDSTGYVAIDTGSKNGTYVNGRAIDRQPLRDGDLIEVGNSVLLFRDSVRRSFREPADTEIDGRAAASGEFLTLNIPMGRRLDALARVATSSVTVLITGESGTGKEVTARALHRRSGRTGDLVAVNCGALAPTLIESELFGHLKGAYSGADTERPGLVRAAHGGTLFLDEIAELPESSQVKLLRVLQEKEVVPVGGTRPITVDLRVIAATHQDLEARVDAGSFRRDLYARLAGFEIDLLPLRERREDIGVLVAALLPRIAGDAAGTIKFQRTAGRALFQYNWPLNVRELQQALASAHALAGAETIRLEHLPASVRDRRPRTAVVSADVGLETRLRQLLRECDGNVSAVAREMGKARVQIRRWCKRFDIDPNDYRNGD